VGDGRGDPGRPWRVNTADARHFTPVSVAHAAFACRCPRCGEGRVFTGLLTVRPSCPACGLDLSAQDAGDGPAAFVILFLGVLVEETELYVSAAGPRGGAGVHVLALLREAEGRMVFVNRGFVPPNLRAPASRAAAPLAGTVHLRGLLRLPRVEKPSWFIADNR